MTAAAMRLSLRAGEKIYINGAVLRVDRKTSVELLNDATFLLESHVIQAEEATTPLRQLYFIAQTMLISPEDAQDTRLVFDESLSLVRKTFADAGVLEKLATIGTLMESSRVFEAMKTIRGLFPIEEAIMGIRPTKAA